MSAENRFTLEDILAEQRRAREAAAEGAAQAEPEEIGRASCRERV